MTLVAAWALAGLAALPILVWLHRRRKKAVPVVVPSLLFLEGEPAAPEAPDRVRFDVELLVGLVAATCLVLGAAGPRRTAGGTEMVVRVVVGQGAWMDARPATGELPRVRVERTLGEIDRALGGRGRVEVVRVPGGSGEWLRAARQGAASLRVIVADRLLDPPPFDVRVVAEGSPQARNVGIIAVDLPGSGRDLTVFATIWNDSPDSEKVIVTLDAPPAGLNALSPGARVPPQEVVLQPFAARGALFSSVAPVSDFAISIDRGGDVVTDDRVALRVPHIGIGFAEGPGAYPASHRAALSVGLRIVGGPTVMPDGEPDLWVGPVASAPPSARLVLSLRPMPEGAAGVRPPAGSAFDPGPVDLAKDLDPAGCDLVYAPGPDVHAPFPIVRAREEGGRRVVEFVPDPLAGNPAPVDHPLWPIFLENLVSSQFGRRGPAHYRVFSDVDLGLESTRLGRDVRPFDPAWLDGAKPVGEPRVRDLRPWLVGGGLLLLAVLWFARRAHADSVAARVP